MKSTNFSFQASSFLLLGIFVASSFAQIGEGGIGVLPKLPCQDQFEALDICHSTNDCEECKILQFSNPFTSGFCGSLNEGLCQADGCCDDACEDDFNRYETCLLNLNLILCEINCAANVGDGNDNVVVIEDEPSTEESEEEVITITLNPTSSPTMMESLTEELEEKGCFEKFGEFGSCTLSNPLECGLCFITNIPLPDSIGTINDFCPVAEESICGFGQCCDSCSEEFTAFSECFSDVVDDITFGTCDLDCNDDDTEEDTTTIDDCANSFTDYSTCIGNNLFSCALCVIDALPDGNDSSDDDGLNALCQDTKDIVCTFGGCCTPCEQEFTKLELCLEVASNIITVGQCDFDCDDTEAPTASPTDEEEDGGGGFFDFGCFSSYNYVRTLDNDNTIVTKMMKELRIGDMVQSNSNTDGTTKIEYSRLYSFGHYAPKTKTKQEYLQIYTSSGNNNKPLEITKDHMVYVVNTKGREIIPIPASAISIGDELVSGGKERGSIIVTKISTKLRNDGVYAPFTESGTIVVNDILASNYISLFDHDTELYNNKYMHWLAHAYQVPHRIWYYIHTEKKEYYTSDGISYWVYYPLQWSTKYYFHNNNTFTSFWLKFMVYSIAHILYGIETLFRIAIATTTTTTMLFTILGGIVTMIIGKKTLFFRNEKK